MTMLRVDLLAWVWAVMSDNLWWSFEGIDRPKSDTLLWYSRVHQQPRNKIRRGEPRSYLAATLLQDEDFLNDWAEQEVDYWIKDGCYDDEWEAHVTRVVHKDGLCPNSADPEERKEYEEAFQKLLKDEDDKRQWLNEHIFEWSDIHETINEACDYDGYVADFLKKHPVNGVARGYGDNYEYFKLEDIVGYTACCGLPVTREDLHLSEETDERHSGTFVQCPNCCEEECVDDLEGFVFTHGRPFDWPPGAPYPPRRHFDGTPLEAAPWED